MPLELIGSISDGLCPERIWHVAWHPSGDILASCGNDKQIQIWAKEQNKWVLAQSLEGHEQTVRRIAWSPNGKYLAAASFDVTTSIWENTSSDPQDIEFTHVSSLEGHNYEVKSVAWDSTGTLLATCSRDKSIWIWEMQEDNEFECLSINSGHSQDIKCVAWHPTLELLASGSYDDTIKFWKDIDGDWECLYTLSGHTSTVWDISFNSTGDRLVSCSDDRSLLFWKYFEGADKWKNVCKLVDHSSRPIFSIDWSHLNDKICTGSGDDSISILEQDKSASTADSEQYKVTIKHEKAHNSDVNCTRWNPKYPNIFASCGDDGTIKIWKVIE